MKIATFWSKIRSTTYAKFDGQVKPKGIKHLLPLFLNYINDYKIITNAYIT